MNEVASRLNTVSLMGNRARVRCYRGLHRRIDYIPSHDVLPIIQHYLSIGTYLTSAPFLSDYMRQKVIRLIGTEQLNRTVEISEDDADLIRDLCGEALQVKGFDQSYAPNKDGRIRLPRLSPLILPC
jgi:hypothetical protein